MARAPKKSRPTQLRRRNRRRQIPDSQQLAGIKQGVGRAVARAFGSAVARKRRGRRNRGMGYHPCHHDAFSMYHLPLPRPTGPYTVIRTTQLVTSNSKLVILGPVFDSDKGLWTNICGYGSLIDGALKTSDSVYRYTFETMKNATWSAAQLTPAAFSVQLMNPNPLQTTSGIVYGGRIRTAWKLNQHREDTPAALASQFISYNMPRLLAAAKLAFRGTHTDAVPFNMSRLAEFTVQEHYDPGSTTVSGSGADFSGFNPQFYWNPSGTNLQFLVCCEWRVRFDPSNPAQASHVQHQHADESIWMKALHAAEAAGNGVIDIADRVAQTGNAIFNGAAGAYRAGRGVRALTAGVGQLALA